MTVYNDPGAAILRSLDNTLNEVEQELGSVAEEAYDVAEDGEEFETPPPEQGLGDYALKDTGTGGGGAGMTIEDEVAMSTASARLASRYAPSATDWVGSRAGFENGIEQFDVALGNEGWLPNDIKKDVQPRLLALGYEVGQWGADGVIGGDTASAIKAFQASEMGMDPQDPRFGKLDEGTHEAIMSKPITIADLAGARAKGEKMRAAAAERKGADSVASMDVAPEVEADVSEALLEAAVPLSKLLTMFERDDQEQLVAVATAPIIRSDLPCSDGDPSVDGVVLGMNGFLPTDVLTDIYLPSIVDDADAYLQVRGKINGALKHVVMKAKEGDIDKKSLATIKQVWSEFQAANPEALYFVENASRVREQLRRTFSQKDYQMEVTTGEPTLGAEKARQFIEAVKVYKAAGSETDADMAWHAIEGMVRGEVVNSQLVAFVDGKLSRIPADELDADAVWDGMMGHVMAAIRE